MDIDYNIEKWGKLPLRHLIVESEEYIVFVDNELDIDWMTSKEYDSKGHKDSTKHNNILSQVAVLECKPNGSLSEKATLDFKRLLGESLALSFDSDYDTAASVLIKAEEYLESRGKELSRKWYLTTAGKVTSIVLGIGVVIWIFRNFFISFVGTTFFIVFLAMVAGSVGALLSIIMRMGNENLDIHAGKELHQLESMYRIIAGMISAILAALAIDSGLIFSILGNAKNINHGIVLIGFLAGMSERFAPSISAKLENKQTNTKLLQH